jgi:hypothetical protein
MKPPLWTALALVVGLLLMLLGPLAVSLFLPTQATWTNEDAEKLIQASANLHAANHAHGSHSHVHGNGQVATGMAEHHDQPTAELAAAQKDYDTQQARLETSRSRQNWLVHGSRFLGVLLAAAGIAGYFLAQRDQRP